MVVTNRYVPLDYAPLQLNNVLLEKVTHFKQLGVFFDEKMTWEAHINHISTIANKKIGLIWKVSLQFPRKCAETIYTNYVQPVLDYGCAVYDNCSRHLTNKLEGVQRNAAVACTRAFRRTPTSSLLTELGWCSLEVRCKYFRLITLYKMIHNRTPGYLRSLLPPRQGQYANRRPALNTISVHQEREDKSTINLSCHKLYERGTSWMRHKSRYLQQAVSRPILRKKLFPTKMQLYCKGKGRSAANHTRMRLGLSHLRQQLHSFGIIPRPECTTCTNRLETVLITCCTAVDAQVYVKR